MDKAKAAVSDFVSKHGKKDTTVHETVNPAVTHETVTPTRHEQVQTAVDREIHQDHHHTSVQPIHDKQVLPEKHSHNVVGVEHRTHDHSNRAETERHLQSTAAQFQDKQTVRETAHSKELNPTIAGEHVHHHVHENIQPVVQRETIQPEVVHTTVPIHEVHHNKAEHHATTALPAVSMSEFQQRGGALEGRGERIDQFEGEPRLKSHHTTATTDSGYGSNTASTGGYNTTTGTGVTSGTTGTTGTTGTKPSLMDKLNPKKDADGDGKAGLMD